MPLYSPSLKSLLNLTKKNTISTLLNLLPFLNILLQVLVRQVLRGEWHDRCTLQCPVLRRPRLSLRRLPVPRHLQGSVTPLYSYDTPLGSREIYSMGLPAGSREIYHGTSHRIPMKLPMGLPMGLSMRSRGNDHGTSHLIWFTKALPMVSHSHGISHVIPFPIGCSMTSHIPWDFPWGLHFPWNFPWDPIFQGISHEIPFTMGLPVGSRLLWDFPWDLFTMGVQVRSHLPWDFPWDPVYCGISMGSHFSMGISVGFRLLWESPWGPAGRYRYPTTKGYQWDIWCVLWDLNRCRRRVLATLLMSGWGKGAGDMWRVEKLLCAKIVSLAEVSLFDIYRYVITTYLVQYTSSVRSR